MSQRGLEALLRPASIAVIGASMKPDRAGFLMMRNLLSGGFKGPILPVTPAYNAVCGVLVWPSVDSLPFAPDLAILCTHAKRNLALLDALGQKGCKACIVLSSPQEQHQALLDCARRWQIRILGPNSLGLLAPWLGLNASFSPVPIRQGRLAFISQSAAVSNTILDWAQQREMGFSYFIALGDSLDIDIDELLDFLGRDNKTSAILLYLEHLTDARRFVSAGRSASRNKPIVVIKSGRSQAAQQLLNTAGGLDIAWDAAIQRAGMLRVQDTHDLFSAVETLSHMRPLRDEKLMVISNGAAPQRWPWMLSGCVMGNWPYCRMKPASGCILRSRQTSSRLIRWISGTMPPRKTTSARFRPFSTIPISIPYWLSTLPAPPPLRHPVLRR